VRAAIFDVRGRAAWGASAHGFGPVLSEKVLHSLIVQLNQDNPFRQVCETADHVDATAATLKKNRNVLDKLKPAPHAPILLLPIRSSGTVSAIFYADPGEASEPLPVNALKILAEFAGAQIDRLIALGGGAAEEDVDAEAVEAAEDESPVEETATEAAAEEATALHSQAAGPEVQALAVEEPVAEAHKEVEVAKPPASEPEPPAPPAVMVVEAPPTPVEAAKEQPPAAAEAIVEAPAPPEEIPVAAPVAAGPIVEPEPPPPIVEAPVEVISPPPPPAPPVPDVALPAPEVPAAPAAFDVTQLSEADQKIHKDAKRFAKLLVSEIELYNKAKVADGRKNHDLYKRLKSDIDRSRQTFQKRFSKTLSTQVDYFHDELVKNLASGDASILGPGYPGPNA
jgi:hypothetical protein